MFQHHDPDDGNSEAIYAELLARGAGGKGPETARARTVTIDALSHAPTNPRAWTLLCGIDAQRSRTEAVHCLDMAFSVTPFDWFTAEARMQMAASEWPLLDEKLRDSVVGLVRPMWTCTKWNGGAGLKDVLLDLSSSDNGRQLLRAGFQSDVSELRDFNRWIFRRQIYGF